MIAYKSPLIAVVPQTFEKQQDIIRATYALMAQQNEALRRRAEELRAVRRDLEAFRRDCGLLDLAIRKVCCDFAAQLRAESKKYSPDQPRIPAGHPDGGQWTREDGVGSSITRLGGANPSGPSRPVQYAALDTGTRTDAIHEESDVQVAAGAERPGYTIDLLEEELRGGHAIREHVGKSDAELLEQMELKTSRLPFWVWSTGVRDHSAR